MSAATERIWNEHAEQLRGFIHRRIPDASVVDDLLQEVFVKIHKKSPASGMRSSSELAV